MTNKKMSILILKFIDSNFGIFQTKRVIGLNYNQVDDDRFTASQ
jgi:hypothetical protein